MTTLSEMHPLVAISRGPLRNMFMVGFLSGIRIPRCRCLESQVQIISWISCLQILQVLHLWLEPSASGRAFLPSGHRTTLLKVLLALPVQKVHLRRSGMGKLAVAMARDHAESGENRMLLRQVGFSLIAEGEVKRSSPSVH